MNEQLAQFEMYHIIRNYFNRWNKRGIKAHALKFLCFYISLYHKFITMDNKLKIVFELQCMYRIL